MDIITPEKKFCNPFDKRGKIKYNSPCDRDGQPRD